MCKSEEQEREDSWRKILSSRHGFCSAHILSLAMFVIYQTSGPKLVGVCG